MVFVFQMYKKHFNTMAYEYNNQMSITKKHQKVPWFYHGFRSFTIVNVSMCQPYKKVLLRYHCTVTVIL